MAQNLRAKSWIVLLMLIGWGALSAEAEVLQAAQQGKKSSVSSGLRAQATSDTAQNQGSVLTFRPKTSTDVLTQLQVNLTRFIPSLPIENSTLTADTLGSVILGGVNGDQRMDTYSWTTDPISKLYMSRSGYKSLLLRYQYGKDRQSQKYTLDISCQTVGLKNQDQATCSLFGNGPLLKGEVRSTGLLTLNETTTDAAPASPSPQPTPKPSSSSTTSPANAYKGRGAFILYPSDAKAQEERYSLTRITVSSGPKGISRLSLVAVEPKAKTVVLQGKLEAAEGGQVLSITTVDGVSGKGKVFVGRNGLLRTTTPIFVGAEDREMSVYFRPN
jgi:hypothetical protein